MINHPTFQPFNCFLALQELKKKREQLDSSGPALAARKSPPPVPPVAPVDSVESVGVATDVSLTTPDKALKKSRVEVEAPAPRRLYDTQDYYPSPEQPCDAAIGGTPYLGQTGESPDEVEELRKMNKQLLSEKAKLEMQVADLTEEIQRMSLDQPRDDTPDQIPEPAVPATDDAARKRLQRICSPSSTGKHGYIYTLDSL